MRTAIVCAEHGANLRQAPQGEIMAALPRGTYLEILRGPITLDGYAWLEVRPLGGDCAGYVGAELVDVRPPAAPDCPTEPDGRPHLPEVPPASVPWGPIAAIAVGLALIAAAWLL
ncbi:MAG: hypothetical protein IT481_08655 [Gammaproteobacteria bacterium]|nr:hypothetical protein [Gammaproteobacteria bacterium]